MFYPDTVDAVACLTFHFLQLWRVDHQVGKASLPMDIEAGVEQPVAQSLIGQLEIDEIF